MRVVIIDDDPDTQEYITLFLESEGFDAYSAQNGVDGLRLTQECDPDLVILDIQLPQMDGWDTCKQIRSFSGVPVLMISAIARDEADIIHGLKIGADDFLIKPLHPRLLMARIDALLRRSHNVAWRDSHRVYIDSHLKIDLHRQEVFVRGERVPLSFLEYRLLDLLVNNANHAVPTLQIIEELWSERVADDYARYVRIYVGRLRKLIEPDLRQPRYIVTEHGFGYRFNPQL